MDRECVLFRINQQYETRSNLVLCVSRVSEKANNQAWGGNEGQRELDAETNAQQDADREAATQSGTATPAAEPQEPEDNTQSYSEYLASQAKAAGEGLAAKLGLNTNKPRQANEGADENQWKNAKPVSKDEEEEALFTGSGKVCFTPSCHNLRAKKQVRCLLFVCLLAMQ